MTGPADRILVLHVDDEPDFAETVGALLEREDERIEVVTATSATEGFQKLLDHEFDCIVSDYEMPERNGVEFLWAVRNEARDLPFILFTAEESETVSEHVALDEEASYLQKGYVVDQSSTLAARILESVDGAGAGDPENHRSCC